MNTLNSLAQNIQDFYLQDYAQGNEFFEGYHYRYLAATIYSNIINEEYKASYARNKAEFGTGFPSLNPEWLIPEEVKLKRVKDKSVGVLSREVFSFIYDRQACGLGEIVPVCSKCEEFVKVSADQEWSTKRLPRTKLTWYWLKSKNEIGFSRMTSEDETVLVNYLPVLNPKDEDTEQYISEAFEALIIPQAITWLKGFNQAAIVDMTNNGNPNKVIESEIDQSFRKKTA